MRRRLWHRAVSIFVLASFLSYDLSWANPQIAGRIEAPLTSTSNVLHGVGNIDEVLVPERSGKSVLIYHIQDAHGHYEAQKNLARILESLIQQERVSLVFVEGGAGNVNLTSLRKLAWKSVRKRVGGRFLREGKISGEEYLQLASDYPFELYGIEDRTLYEQNSQAFLKAIRHKDSAIKTILQLESLIRSQESALYPSEFRHLEAMRRKWQEGEGNLPQYVEALRKTLAVKKIEIKGLSEWPKLATLDKGIRNESFDQKRFFEELKQIETKIRGKYLITPESQKLWDTSRDIYLLKRLFSLELTSEEYAEIKAGQGHLHLATLDIHRFKDSIQELEKIMPLFLKFYQLAWQRDSAFLVNIEKALKEKNDRRAVLITGGFHSGHLGELLKAEGISRVLISPQITSLDERKKSNYETVFREKLKSTLRSPTTFGTPFYFELRKTLEKEQSQVLRHHIERLIGYLDIDHLIQKKPGRKKEKATSRSEVRQQIAEFITSYGTAIEWIALAGVSILAVGIAGYFLLRKNKPVTVPLVEEPPTEVLQGPVAHAVPVTNTATNPIETFAREANRFFQSAVPIIPPHEDLPPPPYELPLPMPLNMIPADLDARGKVRYLLSEVLQAMETMDSQFRSHQKDTAERALRRVLQNGQPLDPERFRQYVQEDIHEFFTGIFQEMKRVSVDPGVKNLPVSEEIESSYPRFPRLVKSLLSENHSLLEDREIKGLMDRISRKFTARPPVADDLENHLKQVYERLKERPRPRRNQEPQSITQQDERPKAAREDALTQVRPIPPKRILDRGKLQAQLRDMERLKQKLIGDRGKLTRELEALQTEYRELQGSLDQARNNNDLIIQEALRPSVEAYENRIQRLRVNNNEITERITQVENEERRIRELLEGEGHQERSELRVIGTVAIVIGAGLLTGTSIYLASAHQAMKRSQKLVESKEKHWPFSWKRIYNETVFLKKEDKANIFAGTEPPAMGFAWLGAILGWAIGGWALYQAYHGWEWDTSKVMWNAGQKKDDAVTLGGVLWMLEIFVAPIAGAITGVVLAFLGQLSLNYGRPLIRILKFPFDYERTLRLNLLRFENLEGSLVEKAIPFVSRMEKETLEVMLQDWVERGEHEKMKAFSEKGVWKGDKQKFVQLYGDVSGLEEAKRLLVDSFTRNQEQEEAVLRHVVRWKTTLDTRKLNGSGILKNLLPFLVKQERKFSGVHSWMERLAGDPHTPWPGGFEKVKGYYDTLKDFENLKEEAVKKFSLDEADTKRLEASLAEWKESSLKNEKKPAETITFLSAILRKLMDISSSKLWFLHGHTIVSGMDKSLFKPSKSKEFIARFDQLHGYEIAKSSLIQTAEGRQSLPGPILELEKELKAEGVDVAIALTDVYSKLRERPLTERIGFIQAARSLNPSIYKKDAPQAFKAIFEKETSKSRLSATNPDAAELITDIEGKAILSSVGDIQNLAGFYNLLIEKTDARSQVFLLSLASRAPPSVLPVLLRSRDSAVSFYLAHRSGRDYQNLPGLAEEYRKRYGELEILNDALLNLLTDPAKTPSERIEQARKTIASQTLIRIGFPEQVASTWDGVSFEEVIRAVGDLELRKKNSSQTSFTQDEIRKEGESLLSRRANHAVVKKAVSKMGRLGLYSHWEETRPSYYLQFLEDTKGLDPAFFRPGEKVRASYDGDLTPRKRESSLLPVYDPIQVLKDLIRAFRKAHPNIYDNFIAPKRELLNGNPLEDFVDEKSLMAVAGQFRKKVPDWPLTEKEKFGMAVRIHLVTHSKELRALLGKSAEEETEYWKQALRLFQEKGGLKKDSELYREIVSQIRIRIDELAQEGMGREGVVQFILTRGSVSDFVRGEISEDCCSEARNLHFTDTVGLPTDPAFLSFRLVENGRWIGNTYAIVLKTSDGKFVFYLDNMPIRISHPVTTTQAKADKLVNNFSKSLKELLEASGFDYFVVASDPSSRDNIRNALRALAGTLESRSATKPGGFGHQSEFGVSSEYIQGLGTLSSSVSGTSYWLELDNRKTRERKKRIEMEELEKRLLAVEHELQHLARIRDEKNGKITHLKGTVIIVTQSSRLVTAHALEQAAQSEELEIGRISAELTDLEHQAIAFRARLEGLKTEVSRSELRTGVTSLLAQTNFTTDIVPLVFLVGLFGLVGLLIWYLVRDWLDGEDRNRYEHREFADRPALRPLYLNQPSIPPRPHVPEWIKHPLVKEIHELFKTVLKSVSEELKTLIPRRIFFPVSPEYVGMELSQTILNVLATAKLTLVALRDKGSLMTFLKEQDYYKRFKEETARLGLRDDFDAPGVITSFEFTTRYGIKIPFHLELSDRTADDLLRGDVSHDCTGLGACSAFYETIPQFLLDPGFLNLKLRMQGKWVGNIYLMVAKKENRPVLVIDAIQVPPAQILWPIHPRIIAQKAVDEITEWAEQKGFEEVVMSSFISNFYYLQEYFDMRYQAKPIEIEKLGGFDHLKGLGLWENDGFRNQYIETFSPQWNKPLKVDPNSSKQELLLRPVRSKESGQARSEMRQDPIWQVNGFELEIDRDDLEVLPQKGISQEDENKMILTRAFQRGAIPDVFRKAGYQSGMKIRVHVHDDPESGRVYKFILVTDLGRRNFILEVGQKGESFLPYSDDLNFIDTALITVQDQGDTVGLRNIFTKWGEPPNPDLHRIPYHGTVYAKEAKEYSKPDRGLKVFDLQIKDHKTPSLRSAMKPREHGDRATELPGSKAVYNFRWNGKDYALGIYAPNAPVILPEPEKNKSRRTPKDSAVIFSHGLIPGDASDAGEEILEDVVKAVPAFATAGAMSVGAGFVKGIVARKREALFKASLAKIEKIRETILSIARRVMEAVEKVEEPSELDRLEDALNGESQKIDQGLSEIETEIARYREGSEERKKLERVRDSLKAEIQTSSLEPEVLPVEPVRHEPAVVPVSQEALQEAGRLKREVESLTSKSQTLGREIESKSKELEQQSQELAHKRREVQTAETEIHEKRGTLATLDGGVAEKQQQLGILEANIQTQTEMLNELEARHRALQAEIGTLEDRRQALERALSGLESLDTDLSRKTDELAKIQRLRDGAKAEYERLLASGEETSTNLAALTAQVTDTQNQLQTLETKLHDLNEKETEQKRLVGELESLSEQISEKSSLIHDLQGQSERLRGQSHSILEENARLESDRITQEQRLSGLKTHIATAQETLVQVGRELESTRGDLVALLRQIEERKSDLEAKEQRVTGFERSIGEKEQVLGTLEERHTKLLGESGTLEDKNREVGELKTKLTQSEQAKTEAERQRDEEKRKAALAVQNLTSQLRTIGERLKETVSALGEKDQELKTLRQETETVKGEREATEERLSTLQAERDQLEGDLEHLKQERSVLHESLRQVERAKGVTESEAALDGKESLEVLLSELPESLWDLLGKHYPRQDRSRFQLTVDSVANELIHAWNRSPFFRRIVKNLVLYRSLYIWFQKQGFYQDFKKEAQALGLRPDFDKPGEWVHFKVPGDKRSYSLELSKRDIEYLLRGFFSGDCTNCGPMYVTTSFLTATGSHITDPGFFNFKILRDGEWVGNVYVMAIRKNGKPVLVIDAIQVPWKGASPLFVPFDITESEYPIDTREDAIRLADSVIAALGEYSKGVGYEELWLSSFVSNFSALKHHFYATRPQEFMERVTTNAKLGNWTALKALGYEGSPYVESIGHPEAKRVWQKETQSPTVSDQVAAPPERQKKDQEPVAKKPEIAPRDNQAKRIATEIKESVQFAYQGILSRDMEFIVKVPGSPIRWIAFDKTRHEWNLYEKSKGETLSYPLFEVKKDIRQQAGTINLLQVEAEIPGMGRVPVVNYLRLPPLKPGELESYVENGGTIVSENGSLQVIPFTKKGFIVNGAYGAFFVHPGDRSLEDKENVTLPLSNHYDAIKGKYPSAAFVLGWHTNPGGEPMLHGEEEKEITRSGIEGLQLVASPKGISLVEYYRENGKWKKREIFTKALNEDWPFELEKKLNERLTGGQASGYQLNARERELLDQVLKRGEKSTPRNIKGDIQKIYFDVTTSYGLEVPGLRSFIENSEFELVVVKPKGSRLTRAPPMGLGLELSRPGRDVYATYEIIPQEEGFKVTVYVGHGLYELADEKDRLEILAHELYQAYREAYSQDSRTYPLDIDLELKIDEEIRNAQAWESQIPDVEREDLGLEGGVQKRTDSHTRSRAFARLVGKPSSDGIGTTYTHLLRHIHALANRFSAGNPVRGDAIPTPPEDAFRYAQDSFENVVSPEGLERLFEMSAYIHEHKEEDLQAFLGRKIEGGKRLLLFNANAPTPWILKDTRKIIEALASEGKLTHVFLDLPPQAQSLIDDFLRSSRASQELLQNIASRFPPFLPNEFQRPDLYLNILRAIYEHNLETPNGGKIQVTAYYRGRTLPPMPGQGPFPPRPENFPFEIQEGQPDIPEFFQERRERPPVMPRMGELPQGLPLPPLPLTQGVREAFDRARAQVERNPESVVLFIKPLDEFLPEELTDAPEVASILHIDRYTGFGPEKPENQLAFYVSEQASPNQKSFALPILAEAPFYEESVNPGLPRGIRFNDFNAYPDLILSTSGDENLDPTPDEVAPEEIKPLVPVGGRSELRKQAVKELAGIGRPAVGPLINALQLPSVSLRLGAIQALGAIGDPAAIGPLNQAIRVAELREPARLAIQSIKERRKTLDHQSRKESVQTKTQESKRISLNVQSLYSSPASSKDSSKASYPFFRSVLTQAALTLDMDAESLIQKENGRVRLTGWGFVESIKALEARLPRELAGQIHVRIVNLNPSIRPDEIERAFGITPEIRPMVEITNIPIRHHAFKGIDLFLGQNSLKIASEKNQNLWAEKADIVVRKPSENELIDGRKLFLTALLHRVLKVKITKELKITAERLLRELGTSSVSGLAYFTGENRNTFSLEFLNQIEQVNRLLAKMA